MDKEIRILLVEDSEEDEALIIREIEKGGFKLSYMSRVQTSHDFKFALENRQWDLIISDYVLPGYSGIDALKDFKEKNIDIPFIMLSGKISEEAAVEIMKSGANNFISKQKLARLSVTIEKELEQAEIRRSKKKTEELLLQSEEKYRLLIKNIPDVTWIYDQNGNISFISENIYKIYGFTAREIIASPIDLFKKRIHPEDSERINSAYDKAFRSMSEINVEYRIQHKQGHWIWINDRATTYFNDKGIIYANAVFSDISAKKAAELSLMESEEKYRILIENIPDITWIADQEGNLVFISPHIKNMTGFEPEEIYKGGFNMTFGQMHPDDAEKARKVYQELFTNNTKIDDEARFKRTDGSWGWFHIRSLNTYVKNGVHYAVGLMSDITQRKEAKTKLKELDDLKTKFIQIVNHQMRTPLTVIRWNLENLIERKSVEGTTFETIRMIEETTLQIIAQISDLLTAMDIKEGRIALNKRKVSLESLVSSVIAQYKGRSAIKNIKINYEKPAEPLPAIEADADKVRDAFSKIINNAFTYAKDEGGEIWIKIERQGDKIRFEVKDNGIGIPDAEQSNIFTLFFRASNASRIQPDASGIGLSIAKYFVEQNGGKIGFNSVEGQGSKFWIEIPITTNIAKDSY